MQNILQTCFIIINTIYSYVFKYKFLHCYEGYNYIGRGVCTKFVCLHEVDNKTFQGFSFFCLHKHMIDIIWGAVVMNEAIKDEYGH